MHTFNVRLLQSKETGWPSKHGIVADFVGDFHITFWTSALSALDCAWADLHNCLRNRYPSPPDGPIVDVNWGRVRTDAIEIGNANVPCSNSGESDEQSNSWTAYGGVPPSGDP